jgi:N-acetylglucosaminyldiphosphoundecaprenol N-acetyl-beta-D-mannosaminyltransferase
MKIWGIPIESVARASRRVFLERLLAEPRYHRIATVNPEFLLLAKENQAFRRTLLEADYRFMDGVGIGLAALLQGEASPERIPGVELMQEVLLLAQEQQLPVFLAIRKAGLSTYEEILTDLLQKYPRLSISGQNFERGKSEHQKFDISNSVIALCNFGAPDQEIFLANLKQNPGALRLAIGVGGAFDYLTGKARRAPQFLRTIGLEWLWRLVLHPRRFPRIWRSVVIFPFRLIFGKIDS